MIDHSNIRICCILEQRYHHLIIVEYKKADIVVYLMRKPIVISVAFGNLAIKPPDWLLKRLDQDEIQNIESSNNLKRMQELRWSRGLKAELLANNTDSDSLENYPCRIFYNECEDLNCKPCTSISHDKNLTAVAISSCNAIGIDLQFSYPAASCIRISETWFPSPESEEIRSSSGCSRFLQSWVMKEAYAKCMRRSIFDACQEVGIWDGKIHVPGSDFIDKKFAWALFDLDYCVNQITGSKSHPAWQKSLLKTGIGICWSSEKTDPYQIQCLAPGPGRRLHHFDLHWESIPMASGN